MELQQPIISVSGLRGIVGTSLTPLVAARYAAAFASTLPHGKLVVTRDGRRSGDFLAQVICGALRAIGHDVLYASVAATPTTGILVRQRQAVGGIQISASHNPAEYNGMKLFGASGRVISSVAGQDVLSHYHAGTFSWSPYSTLGNYHDDPHPHAEHLSKLLQFVDVPTIRNQKFSVVLDANHGAGSILGRMLLSELGCQVTLLGDTPDGEFDHPPEPTAKNLVQIANKVRTLNADIGFCQDPDADRLAMIDEHGNYIGEEMTVALCADHILAIRKGPIVTNCSTSRMTEDIAAAHGVPFHRSRVGEAHVCDVMVEHRAVFGGEGNGGPIDPRIGYVRDSFVGMALILESMATQQQTLSTLVAGMPQYAMEKSKVELPADQIPAAFAALAEHFSSARLDKLDGFRFDWPGKWLLVRQSNTEPIVRFIAEAQQMAAARQLCSEAAQVVARLADTT